MSCPSCHSTEICLSKRKKAGDFLMKLLRMTPCRCLDCRKRFFVPFEVARSIERTSRPYRRLKSSSEPNGTATAAGRFGGYRAI